MKRILTIALVASMLLSLVACVTGTPPTSASSAPASATAPAAEAPTTAEKTTITYVTLGGTGMEVLQQAAKDFEAETGIAVKIEDWAYGDAYQKIRTLADAGNAPDCMYGFSSWTEQFKEAGYIVAAEDYISKGLRDDFSEAARGVCSADGKMWTLPSYMSVRTLLINEKAFTDAGISKLPTTWDEFLAAAPKLTNPAKGKYAYAMVAGQAKNTLDCWLPILWAYDADVLNADGTKNGFNNPQGVAALQMYVDLAKYAVPDYGEADINTTQSNFTTQTAAAYFHNAQGLAALKDANEDFSWATIIDPLTGPTGKKVSLGVMDIDLLFKTGREEAAGKWMEYWHSKDREGLVIEQTGWVPNQKSFLERPSFSDPANVMVTPFIKLEPIAKFKPSIINWEEVQKVLADAVTKAVMGQLAAEEALAAAGEQVDKLLAKA